jgi:hypothetical protein
VGNDLRDVNSPFPDPTHGKRTIAAAIWSDARIKGNVLEEQVAKADPISTRFLESAKKDR